MEDQTGEIQNTDENLSPSDNGSEEIVDAGQPEEKPEKDTLSDKEKALIKARDDKAERARQAEERAIRAEEKARLLEEQLTSKPEPEEEFDPDMPLTFADLKRIEAEKEQKRQAEAQKKQTADFQKRVLSSVETAREKYKDSVHTYDWALEHARKNWSEEDLNAIALMKDPAQKLYDLVMLDTGNVGKESVKDTLETINKNLNSAGTLSETGGANKTLDSLKQIDKMPSKDFIEKMDEIIRTRQ
jgi:hypothetical protein